MTSSPTVTIDVSRALEPFSDMLRTKRVVLQTDLLPHVYAHTKDLLPTDGTWAIVADAVTWSVAGEAVRDGIAAAGQATSLYTIEPAEGEATPVADEAKVELLRAWLVETRPSAVIAVGAGTVNDLAKMASFKAEIPYAVVGTAPSMNGYTSSIAALLTDGVKTTQPCDAPVVCLADLDVMAQSPHRMIASGLGDLISKPVSNADWRLSYRLLGSSYSDKAMILVEHGAKLLEGIAHKLPLQDREAVGKLTASLCLSGLAMSVAGSSSPASGGEHLISHYIDMTHFAFGDPHDFHGCQVGVGTISTAALYEQLAAMDPSTIDIPALVAAHPSWETREASIRAHFGPLSDAVLAHAKKSYIDAETLRTRLTTLVHEWDSIISDVRTTLRPAASIRDELLSAKCPVTFQDIDVTPQRARNALAYCKDIRARYTILHLAAELGTLEAWSANVLRDFHNIQPE